MLNRYVPVIATLIIIFSSQLLYAHAVKGTTSFTQAPCVKFKYDDGEPMSYAEVIINIPGESLPFQKGRSDANGRFCFYPDQKTTYQVKASDGIGHSLTLSVDANAIKSAPLEKENPSSTVNRLYNIVIGLLALFTFFGILAFFKRRSNL